MQLADHRSLGLRGRLRRAWRVYVTETARLADAESDAYRAFSSARTINRTVVAVLLTSALALTLINFFAKDVSWIPAVFDAIGLDGAGRRARHAFTRSDHAQLNHLAVWTGVQLVAYVLIPIAVVIVWLGLPLRDFGIDLKGTAKHWKVYVALYLISLPFIVAASFSDAFLDKYPFYRLADGEALWPSMAVWWVMYAVQFVALEFFFRGFMLHGLRWRLGYAAIYVMVVPYNMIHFGKPLAEAVGAIFGGVTLGTLSLRTRSIWWGAGLHIAVAGTMDVLALVRQGVF